MSEEIRTSDPSWVQKAMESYDQEQPFAIKDDAHVGITTKNLESKNEFIKWSQVGQVGVGFGIMGVGMKLIRIASMDPEPTSKLAFLCVGGVISIIGGMTLIAHAFGLKWTITLRKDGAFILSPV